MYRLGNIDESWRALQSFFIILLTSGAATTPASPSKSPDLKTEIT
jgi:hypothetical protein